MDLDIKESRICWALKGDTTGRRPPKMLRLTPTSMETPGAQQQQSTNRRASNVLDIHDASAKGFWITNDALRRKHWAHWSGSDKMIHTSRVLHCFIMGGMFKGRDSQWHAKVDFLKSRVCPAGRPISFCTRKTRGYHHSIFLV